MTEQYDDNKLIAERRTKLQNLREQGYAFPNQFKRDSLAQDLQNTFGTQNKPELEALNHLAAVAGRIMAKRGPFLVLQDGSGRIQLYMDRKTLPAELLDNIKHWDIGDIVGARGPVHKSGKGDLYIYIQQAELLTKSLRPLPEKYHGVTDQEQRYRQRYVDLIMNDDTRRVFRTRSAIINYLRRFMTERGYLEVETPMLQVIPGGAAAQPFITHHNALDLAMYLRVAQELYIKRLLVGGFDKIFELNRIFRNEGLSTRHNPEFTMMEWNEAYADYIDYMDMTEQMLRGMVQEILGASQIQYQGETIDFAVPFARLSVLDAIVKYNPDMPPEQLNDLDQLRILANTLGIEHSPEDGLGKLQMDVFDATVEPKLRQPTFITAYPTEVSPLSRRNDQNPQVTDRFELFICGRELVNGFSELNDPEDQAERFHEQVAQKDAGDDEAMYFDADYIRALEYGLPPNAGGGIGIDRLVMLLTDSASIRDVILFPHMRPEG